MANQGSCTPAIVLALLWLPWPAAAQVASAIGTPSSEGPGGVGLPSGDAVVRIYESTFNELAAALEPIRFRGHYTFQPQVCTDWPWGRSCVSTRVCESDWTADVTHLRFAITPAKVRVTGRVSARWCGASFNAPLETTSNVWHAPFVATVPGVPPQQLGAIRVAVAPTQIQPAFSVLGYDVRLPIRINVAPSLSLPAIPIVAGVFRFETARGPHSLRLSPTYLYLARRQGHFELQADVGLQ